MKKYAETAKQQSSFFMTAVCLEFALAAIGMTLVGFFLKNPLKLKVYGSSWGIVTGVLATIPLLIMLRAVMRIPWGPLVRLSKVVEEDIVPLFVGLTPLQVAILAFSAGFGEEWLFRAFFQDLFETALETWQALLIASLVFGACHWLTTSYAVLATLMGLFLGMLYIQTDGLFAPITTHALYDYLAIRILVRRYGREGQDGLEGEMGTGGDGENEGHLTS